MTIDRQEPINLKYPPGHFSALRFHFKNSISFFSDPVKFTEKLRNKFGDIFVCRIFGMHFLFITSSKYKDWVLQGEGRYLKNDWQPTLNKLFWPSTLPLLTGEQHKQRRQIVAQLLANQFQKNIALFQKKAEKFCFNLVNKKNICLEVEFKKLTSQIATLALLEKELHLLNLLEQWVAGFFAFIPINFAGTTFYKALRAKNELKKNIVAELKNTSINYTELFNGASHEEIAEEIQHLLFASYNTTAISLTNAVVLLTGKQDLKDNLKKAVDANWDKLQGNPLACSELNNFIYYALMQIPSVLGVFRETTEEVTFNNYTIPKGWKVVLQPAHETLLTQDSLILNNQDTPEVIFNWIKQAPKDSFYPFGGGSRLCLGKNVALSEMALVLSHLLHFNNWTLVPEQDLSYKKMPFPIPRSGLIVDFH